MFNIHQIIEGWKNHLFPDSELKNKINEISKERLYKCKTCKFNSTPGNITNTSRCKACGCLLKPKSKCLSCNCGIEVYNSTNPNETLPLLWTAILDKEIDQDIRVKLQNNDS